MLTFYFGAKENLPGGIQTLILNIASGYNKTNQQIKLIASPEGFVYKQAVKRNLRFVFIDMDGDYKEKLTGDDIVVCFGTLEMQLRLFSGTGVRIFYWSVFPDVILDTFQIRLPLRKEIYSKNNLLSKFLTRKLARQLAKASAAYFMDGSHLIAMEKAGLDHIFTKKNLLPIPISIDADITADAIKSVSGDTLNLAYIGRVDDWKIHPFVRLVKDLKASKSGKKVCLYLISENGQAYLEFLKKEGVDPGSLTIVLKNDLSGEQLTSFLQKKIHLVFAMGTSLLEACKVYVPAVITDPSYGPLPDNYTYRFVFNEKAFCLGLPTWLFTNSEGYSLLELFKHILENEENYRVAAIKSFEYALYNHEVSNWLPGFIKAVDNSDMKISALGWAHRLFKRKQLLYRIISLR